MLRVVVVVVVVFVCVLVLARGMGGDRGEGQLISGTPSISKAYAICDNFDEMQASYARGDQNDIRTNRYIWVLKRYPAGNELWYHSELVFINIVFTAKIGSHTEDTIPWHTTRTHQSA